MIRQSGIIIIWLLIFTMMPVVSKAQDPVSDSLSMLLKNTSHDSIRIVLLNDLADHYKYSSPDTAIYYLETALSICEKESYPIGKARTFSNLGDVYDVKGDFAKQLEYYGQAVEIYQSLGMKKELSDLENSLGRAYEKQGKLDVALQKYLSSLKTRETLGDKKGIASSLNSIGLVYMYQGDMDKAKEYFENSLELVTELDSKMGMATVLNNLGLVYDNKEDWDKALSYFEKSMQIHEEMGNSSSVAKCLNNIGNMYYMKKEYAKSFECYKKSIAIKEELGDQSGIVNTNISIGVLFQKQNKFNEAIYWLEKARDLGLEIRHLEGLRNAYDVLSELYASTGSFQKAYESMRLMAIYKDTLLNEENTRVINQLREQYGAEKREKEIQLQKAVISGNELKIKQQATQIYAFIVGSLLLLILAIVVLNGYRQKKKANVLLASQNEKILKQKGEIEDKNRNILASITYAKRIQEAILPPEKLVRENYQNSFVLYHPKDIVSGDFYWMDVEHEKTLFSVVDCTGHGVPGAFMSIVGYNGLNQAVNEFNLVQPGLILDKLNEIVEQTLNKSHDQTIKDGMDIALCVLDPKSMVLEFAGANNPAYIVRKTGVDILVNEEVLAPNISGPGYSLYEIRANKQPVGHYINRQSFNNNTIPLHPGDSVYIFSDGYPDQFGGPLGKKFKYKPFKELILSIQNLDMTDQKKLLEKTLEDWKSGFEQVDDICIIGVRV